MNDGNAVSAFPNYGPKDCNRLICLSRSEHQHQLVRNRRLLAVMFTDVRGFSDLAALDEDAALDTLRHHNRIMKPLISAHRGTFIKTIGDSVMGKFSAASDALDCALAMQLRLKQWNIARPRGRRISVRIGVHVGDVVVVKNDILGVVTNLAKRLESMAPAGHVCCTDATRLMVFHLPRYKFTRSGSWRPKGSRQEIEFFSVAQRKRASSSQPIQ